MCHCVKLWMQSGYVIAMCLHVINVLIMEPNAANAFRSYWDLIKTMAEATIEDWLQSVRHMRNGPLQKFWRMFLSRCALKSRVIGSQTCLGHCYYSHTEFQTCIPKYFRHQIESNLRLLASLSTHWNPVQKERMNFIGKTQKISSGRDDEISPH